MATKKQTKKTVKKIVTKVDKKNDCKAKLNDLENKLGDFFTKKMPAFPDKAKEIIVQYGPYFILIMMILTIPAILATLGLGAMFTPFALMGGVGFGIISIMSLLFLIGMIALQIVALPALFKRQLKGWKILFYLSLISAVSNIINFDLGSLIIGTGISWYVLFQVKSYYK